MPDLSHQALAVCADHWRPRGASCGRCPIHAACTSPAQPLTEATLDAWRGRVNAAAEQCACFPGTCRGGEVINGRLANGQRCRQHEEIQHG